MMPKCGFPGPTAAAIVAIFFLGCLSSCSSETPVPSPVAPDRTAETDSPAAPREMVTDKGLSFVQSAKPEDLLMALPYSVDSTVDTPEKLAACVEGFKRVARSGLRLSDAVPRMADILRLAELRPGAEIADIGCGTGFFEYAVLEHNIPVAKVYAIDIDSRALDVVRLVLEEVGYPDRAKIEAVLAKEDDMTLPEGSIDDVFVINLTSVYLATGEDREATRQVAWIRSAHRALRPGGRLHIIEYSTSFQGTSVEQKTRFLKRNGFRQINEVPETGTDFTYLAFERK